MQFSGKRLRRMRERERLTQQEVAEAMKLPLTVVKAMEGGKPIPSHEEVRQLCTVLCCERADLYE